MSPLRIIDADSVEPEAVLMIASIVKQCTVNNTDRHFIGVIGQTRNLNHRNLIRSRAVIIRNNPLSGSLIIAIAIIIVDNMTSLLPFDLLVTV